MKLSAFNVIFCSLFLVSLGNRLNAQYVLNQNVFSNGSAVANDTTFAMHASIGQEMTGEISDSVLISRAGFWYHFNTFTDITIPEVMLPHNYTLYQNFPNPFNATTAISYSLSANSDVELNIYNAVGQNLFRLVKANQQAGRYKMRWDAGEFASGVYFYQLKAVSKKQTAVLTRKMILLK